MVMVLTGFVLVVLQSSTVHAQWTTNGNNINNTNSGNVGIGTASPAMQLHVVNPSTAQARIESTGAAGAALDFKNTSRRWVIGTGLLAGGGDFSIYDANASLTRMYFNTSGNVGIGTTTPGEFVHVRKDQGAATHLLVENATAGASAYADLQVKNDLGHFAQFGLYSSTTSTAGALAAGNAFTYTTSPAMVIMANNGSGIIKFATGGINERMRIDASGNVGIGTASPSAQMHVATAATGYGPLFKLEGTANPGNGATRLFLSNPQSNLILSAYGSGSPGILANAGGLFADPPSSSLIVGSGSNMPLYLVANGSYAAPQFTISTAGNVGIGLTNPSDNLEVSGNIKVSGTGNINASGTITGGNIVAKYQDVAEWVQSSQALSAGTVVVLDQTKSNQVIASSQAYDTRVAGVVSSQPGIALGENGAGKVLVATTGRVKVKVDATAGPIHVGDLLVTSDKEGVAKRSEPLKLGGVQIHRPGTLIGKALEPLAKGTGEILVLLSLQ